MPDFDGTGPLKRGRAIGRGLGPCRERTGPGLRGCTNTAETRDSDPNRKAASGT
jgi:hypothetical protein